MYINLYNNKKTELKRKIQKIWKNTHFLVNMLNFKHHFSHRVAQYTTQHQKIQVLEPCFSVFLLKNRGVLLCQKYFLITHSRHSREGGNPIIFFILISKFYLFISEFWILNSEFWIVYFLINSFHHC